MPLRLSRAKPALALVSGLLLAALLGLTLQAAPAGAQDSPLAGGLAPLMHGALVFHGNYCGPGNKGDHPAPVDALDAACMRHDACVTDFEIPSCACNARLARDATIVARDPRAPLEEREAAEVAANGAGLLPCR